MTRADDNPALTLQGAGVEHRDLGKGTAEQAAPAATHAGRPFGASCPHVGASSVDRPQELRNTKPAAAPGTAFEYSNGNFILAGLIVERASGEPYAQYVQRHIFAPLGMRKSYVALDAAKRAGLATGHRYWFGLAAAHGPTFRGGIQSAGYLISSAQDMGRYLAMYLNDGVTANGQRIVSRRGLQTMNAAADIGAASKHA